MGKRKREKHKPGSVGAEEAAGRGADPGFRPIGIGVYDAHRGGAFASAQIDVEDAKRLVNHWGAA